MDKKIVKIKEIKICPHCKNKMTYVIFDNIDCMWICYSCDFSYLV